MTDASGDADNLAAYLDILSHSQESGANSGPRDERGRGRGVPVDGRDRPSPASLGWEQRGGLDGSRLVLFWGYGRALPDDGDGGSGFSALIWSVGGRGASRGGFGRSFGCFVCDPE